MSIWRGFDEHDIDAHRNEIESERQDWETEQRTEALDLDSVEFGDFSMTDEQREEIHRRHGLITFRQIDDDKH